MRLTRSTLRSPRRRWDWPIRLKARGPNQRRISPSRRWSQIEAAGQLQVPQWTWVAWEQGRRVPKLVTQQAAHARMAAYVPPEKLPLRPWAFGQHWQTHRNMNAQTLCRLASIEWKMATVDLLRDAIQAALRKAESATPDQQVVLSGECERPRPGTGCCRNGCSSGE